jgi:hypothetical protein
VRPHLPSSAHDWTAAIAQTLAGHQPARQRAMIEDTPADKVALWLEALTDRLWTPARPALPASSMETRTL